MQIPFVALNRDKDLNDKIKNACSIVIDRGNFIFGQELEQFEKNFAEYCNSKYAVGVANGTDAITLALKAHGIGQGDEVITAANTAIPTVAAIVNSGAKPVLADVNENYLIDPPKIEERVTDKTKAIVPVHLYGRACDMNKILQIAGKYNLKIIEDCAQAHGAIHSGKKVPVGETGCFSFYPSKNLGCYGDGGMVVTNNKEINDKLRLLRNYGQSDRYHAKISGQNSRLDEIQAAVLNTRLKYLENFTVARRDNAKTYNSLLENLVITPELQDEENRNVFHLYVIRTENRDNLVNYLKEKGIGTAIHYPIPIHLQEAYSHLGKHGDFPNAEKFSKEIISLPMFPELTRQEICEVAQAIKSWKAL